MRVVGVHAPRVPGIGALEIDYLPVGLVAILGPDGRSRRALHAALSGDAGQDASHVTSPRIADPRLGRIPDGLADLLRTGYGAVDPDQLAAAGARALAWSGGLDRITAARERLERRRRARATADREVPTELLLARIRDLEEAPAEMAAIEQALLDQRAADTTVSHELEAATMEWLRERQDAETQLQAYRDRARELKVRLGELEGSGPDATCPTCRRPLADHLGEVLELLRDEWDAVVQDGSWWRRRREQLESRPARLAELEARAFSIHTAIDELERRLGGVNERVRELDEARQRLAAQSLPGSAPGAGPDPVAAVEAALAKAERELLDEAFARLLDRTAAHLVRLTEGRLLGARRTTAGPLELVGPDGPLGAPADEDSAALEIAIRLAAVELVWRSVGAPDPALVVGHAFDRLDESVKVRAADLFAESVGAGRLVQVLVVTKGEVVDRIPEAFDGVCELRAGTGSGAVLRPVPAGMGVVRLRDALAG